MSTDNTTSRQLGDYGADHQQLAVEVGRADDPKTVDLTEECVEDDCGRTLSGRLARNQERCAWCLEGDE